MSSDCAIGASVRIGERNQIKRSNIGRGCTIGDSVKIINSVLMDHVTVQDGCGARGGVRRPARGLRRTADVSHARRCRCCIVNTVICNGALVGSQSSLRDCIVGAQVQIQPKCASPRAAYDVHAVRPLNGRRLCGGGGGSADLKGETVSAGMSIVDDDEEADGGRGNAEHGEGGSDVAESISDDDDDEDDEDTDDDDGDNDEDDDDAARQA